MVLAVQRPASCFRGPLRSACPRHQPSFVLWECQTWPSLPRRFILTLWIGHEEQSVDLSASFRVTFYQDNKIVFKPASVGCE